jgi:hypothetical protein
MPCRTCEKYPMPGCTSCCRPWTACGSMPCCACEMSNAETRITQDPGQRVATCRAACVTACPITEGRDCMSYHMLHTCPTQMPCHSRRDRWTAQDRMQYLHTTASQVASVGVMLHDVHTGYNMMQYLNICCDVFSEGRLSERHHGLCAFRSTRQRTDTDTHIIHIAGGKTNIHS